MTLVEESIMTTKVISVDEQTLKLVPHTCLDNDFKQAFTSRAKGSHRHVVDLASIKSLDSAALGMLIMLKAHAKPGEKISLENVPDPMKGFLDRNTLGKLFNY